MNISVVTRTLISRLLLIILIVICAIPALFFLLMPVSWYRESKLYYRLTHYFYWLVLKISFVPIRFHGKENLPEIPAVIVANHQSSLDIPIIGYLMHQHPHIWLATVTLLSSPLLGFVLKRIAALIDMSSPRKGMISLMNVLKIVNQSSCHAIIFPEGGRFVDGKIHHFYGGFVMMAKKTGRPVVPVYMKNLHKVYPPTTFWIFKHPVDVVIGKAFYYKEHDTDESFKQHVYDWFVEQQNKE